MGELRAPEYKIFEAIKNIRDDGKEYWSARDLALALDYTKWENFSKVIKRAMIACYNVGKEVRAAIENIGGTMPEDLPTPEKSIQQIEKEQMKRLKDRLFIVYNRVKLADAL